MQKPSPSLHEGIIDNFMIRDAAGNIAADPALTTLREAMASTRRDAERMYAVAVAINQDVSVLPMARAVRAKAALAPIVEAAAKRIDAAMARTQTELQRSRAASSAPPPPINAAELALEQEIRGRLSTMTEKERGAMIAQAVQQNDLRVVGAVARGPAWLAGLTDAERDMRLGLWRHKAHGPTVDREERIGKALAAVDRAGVLLLDYVTGLIDAKMTREAERVAANITRATAEVQS